MSEAKTPIQISSEPLSVADQEEILNFINNGCTQRVITIIKHKLAACEHAAMKTAIEGLNTPGYKDAAKIEFMDTVKYRNFLEVIAELQDPKQFPLVQLSIE